LVGFRSRSPVMRLEKGTKITFFAVYGHEFHIHP
jgi:hypothetical protein